MRKIYLLIILLLSVLFLGCDLDGNFGIKNLYSTRLLISELGDSEVKLYCESEKLGISSLSECDDITNDERILDWLQSNNLDGTNGNFKVFYIPSISEIEDRNNINIYLECLVNNEKYKGNLYIKSLQESSSSSFKESIVLKTEDEKTLMSTFVYRFWRSI